MYIMKKIAFFFLLECLPVIYLRGDSSGESSIYWGKGKEVEKRNQRE